jgi:hypothetical protein
LFFGLHLVGGGINAKRHDNIAPSSIMLNLSSMDCKFAIVVGERSVPEIGKWLFAIAWKLFG